MALHEDDLDGTRSSNLTVRFLIADAEIRLHADNCREICILGENFLRFTYSRGLRPHLQAGSVDVERQIKVEKYLHDVKCELENES